MCLYLHKEDKLSFKANILKYKKKAKKDIVTYKVVKSDLYSFWQGFKYEIGFHYHQTGKFKEKFEILEGSIYLEVHRGLHSYSSLKKAEEESRLNTSILKCIIPKGSTYFTGIYRDKVSDQLIIIKQLN